MSDQPESAQVQPERVELPIPQVSEASSGQQSSQTAFDEQALVDKLAAKIDEAVTRQFQSAKDKRFADVERISEYLKANGGDVARATREMQIDQMLQQQAQPRSQSSSGREGADGQTQLQQRASDILTDADIAPDDPIVKEWAAKTYGSEADALHALSRSVVKRGKQERDVSGSTVTPETDGGIPGSGDKEQQLTRLYARLSEAQRNPTKNAAERAELKAAIAKLEG